MNKKMIVNITACVFLCVASSAFGQRSAMQRSPQMGGDRSKNAQEMPFDAEEMQAQQAEMQKYIKAKFPRAAQYQQRMSDIQKQTQEMMQKIQKGELSMDQAIEPLRELVREKYQLENDIEYKVEQDLSQMAMMMKQMKNMQQQGLVDFSSGPGDNPPEGGPEGFGGPEGGPQGGRGGMPGGGFPGQGGQQMGGPQGGGFGGGFPPQGGGRPPEGQSGPGGRSGMPSRRSGHLKEIVPLLVEYRRFSLWVFRVYIAVPSPV